MIFCESSRHQKKAQMSTFIIIGFVMFVVLVFVFSVMAQAGRQRNQEQADQLAEALSSSTSVKVFVDNCVSFSSRRAFNEISLYGGHFPNVTKPGLTGNINEQVSFMSYFDDDLITVFGLEDEEGEEFGIVETAYLLSRSQFDVPPQYPCPLFGSVCGGPGTNAQQDGIHFCNYSLSNPDLLATCRYGHRQPIIAEITNRSIKSQLEYKISEYVSECLDSSFFTQDLGYDVESIKPENIETFVQFGDRLITFSVNVPFSVSVSNVASVRFVRSTHVLNTDFKRMLDVVFIGVNSALYREWTDIFNNFKRSIEEALILNRLDYSVEQIPNLNVKDDLFIIRHNTFTIDGRPYEFRFAVGNRVPVLSTINYAPDNISCEILVPPGTNVTIEPDYADPDHDDEIEVFYRFSRSVSNQWGRNDNVLHREVNLNDDGLIITVNVSDGQFYNYQEVRLCVDPNVDVSYNPRVELYYEYEGFDDKYFDVERGRNIQIITREDPIKLITGQGFSGNGRWRVGACERETSSSCIVFPGWKPCDQEFEVDLENIKTYFDECVATGTLLHSIEFIPDSADSISVPVRMKQCLPHRDFSGEGDENSYLETNTCCNEDFTFKGSGAAAESQEQLVCGIPGVDVTHSDANNIFVKSISSSCLPNRGNYYEIVDDGSSVYTPSRVFEDNILHGNERRCRGCGLFGDTTTNSPTLFDFSLRNQYMDTFESFYYKENDPLLNNPQRPPYICNNNYACVESFVTGRGRYDVANYLQNEDRIEGMLKCKAACNDGNCNYAVDCVCTNECGVAVPEICENKAVGELTGTCTGGPFNQDYFPNVCSQSCQEIDIQENRFFKCLDPDDPEYDPEGPFGDCVACNPVCDGKSPNERLGYCDLHGNPGVENICTSTGQLADRVESGGRLRCINNPEVGCTASIECHNNFVGEFITTTFGEVTVNQGNHLYFADMCNSDCQVADSNVCWSHPENNVPSICHEKTPGEGFHQFGRPERKDAFCTNLCGFQNCGNFAYKGGDACMDSPSIDSCCYAESDNVPLDVKCNIPNPSGPDCMP